MSMDSIPSYSTRNWRIQCGRWGLMRPRTVFVIAACNAETNRLLYVFFVFFVDHAGNKIDEDWEQISRRGVLGTGRNFAGS